MQPATFHRTDGASCFPALFGRSKRALLAGGTAVAVVSAFGGSIAVAATRAKGPASRVRCVSVGVSGAVVQTEPARKGVTVSVVNASNRTVRAKTDIAGRAQVLGSFGSPVRASAGSTKPRAFVSSPCYVSVTAIAPSAFVPVKGVVKGRAPLTLGFGTGELVVPGGALQNGVQVTVRRAPKSIALPEPTATAVSDPIEVATTDNAAPTTTFVVTLVAPLPPTESGAPSLRVLFVPAGQDVTQSLPVTQRDLVATVAMPGPGTIATFLAPAVTLPTEHPLITGTNIEEPAVAAPSATPVTVASRGAKPSAAPPFDPTKCTYITDAEVSAVLGEAVHLDTSQEQNALRHYHSRSSRGDEAEFCYFNGVNGGSPVFVNLLRGPGSKQLFDAERTGKLGGGQNGSLCATECRPIAGLGDAAFQLGTADDVAQVVVIKGEVLVHVVVGQDSAGSARTVDAATLDRAVQIARIVVGRV